MSVEMDLDKIDKNGCSPMYYAITKNHDVIASLLYFKGATIICPLEKLAKFLCM